MRQIFQQSRGKRKNYFKDFYWLFFHIEQFNDTIHLGHIKYYDILAIVQKYINKDKQGQARTYQEIMCPLPICDLFDTVTVSFLVYSKSKTEIGVILLWSLYYDKILH